MIDFSCLDTLRAKRPLVHCVSNTVTANDCANLALAVGASPIMAHAPQEMADITALSAATVLNTGTPDEMRFRSCMLCGVEAALRNQPVVLDPVGVGASPWRLRKVGELLRSFPLSILRVNWGEAQALLGRSGREQGVDSLAAAGQSQKLCAAAGLARQLSTVVLLSGAEDIVTDGTVSWCIRGGSGLMPQITGAGCMLSVLCGVFAAVEPVPLSAALLASAFWKVCAQQAGQAAEGKYLGKFRTALFDAAGTLTAQEISSQAHLELL